MQASSQLLPSRGPFRSAATSAARRSSVRAQLAADHLFPPVHGGFDPGAPVETFKTQAVIRVAPTVSGWVEDVFISSGVRPRRAMKWLSMSM